MKIAMTFLLGAGLLTMSGCAFDGTIGEPSGPRIVEHFACNNYCPGPRERYVKRIYKGISDSGECHSIGGRPYTYMEFDEKTVCLAP